LLSGASCSAERDKAAATNGATSDAVEKAAWLTSYDQAKADAVKRNVPILVDFSGSDWCGWCIKLDKEVFSKPEFKDFAAQHLVLLLVDFPRSQALSPAITKQNEKLSEDFGVRGFPTVLILDGHGKELARTGYRPGGAVEYVKHLQGLIGKK
jgi:protein disulfide-isomerase